jgi:hypothetical protein
VAHCPPQDNASSSQSGASLARYDYDIVLELLSRHQSKKMATADVIDIEGVIPLEPTSMQTLDESPDITHHWTNIGMFAIPRTRLSGY